MMFKRAAEALSEGIQPQRQPPTEDDYAYCAECNSVEMCQWYPLYGCQFRSLPSAQTHWIPCSERLPEVSKDPYFIDEIDGEMLFESERVLVFGKNEDGYDYAVATNIYSTAMGNEWSGAYDAAENELTQILAWRPLPKPYGGESE